MQLKKDTLEVLKNFASINTNLVIKEGSKISTISCAKDIIASFEGDDEFEKKLSIYNLNEFLGVLSAFDKPELELDDKEVLIKQGKQKVKYVYAEEELLIAPPDNQDKIIAALKNPDISFTLDESTLAKLSKMSNILGAEDFAVIGDGKTITLMIFDKKNPSANTFELDLEIDTTETFRVNVKVDKLKMLPGSYDVDISSKKISRFKHTTLNLTYYISIEADSSFA